MAFRIITVPLPETQDREQEVNHFLATHAVVGVQRRFVERGEDAFLVFVIEYASGAAPPREKEAPPQVQVDWREELDDDQYRVLNLLRDVRKRLAEEEGVKVFNVFTNAQLVEMVRRRVPSLAALKEVPKVGDGRIEKYGRQVMEVLAVEYGDAARQAGTAPPPGLAGGGGKA